MGVTAGHLQKTVVVAARVLLEVEEGLGNLEAAEELEAQGAVEEEIEIYQDFQLLRRSRHHFDFSSDPLVSCQCKFGS